MIGGTHFTCEKQENSEHELRNLPKQISGSLRNLQNKFLGHKKCIAFLCVLKIFRIFNTQELHAVDSFEIEEFLMCSEI